MDKSDVEDENEETELYWLTDVWGVTDCCTGVVAGVEVANVGASSLLLFSIYEFNNNNKKRDPLFLNHLNYFNISDTYNFWI